MKTTRTFASVCLSASCIALIAAANVSVGDQPGVYKMTSKTPPTVSPAGAQRIQPIPEPPPLLEAPGTINLGAGPIDSAPGTMSLGATQFDSSPGTVNLGASTAPGPVLMGGAAQPGAVTMDGSGFVPDAGPVEYMARSGAVTSPMVGGQAFQSPSPFGPQLMFEQNIDDGLGFRDAYTRINARLPWHVNPNHSVFLGDLSGSVTSDGDPFYNFGIVGRHYDESRNRIFGANFFVDLDYTGQLADYTRIGAGFESMGRWLDFFANGYLVQGNDSVLGSTRPLNTLGLQGMNVIQTFEQFLENQYSGFDAEIGGPLPVIGRRGANMYVGTYFLGNDKGRDALGFSLRGQLQATESVDVNVFYTNDETFGENSWVSMSYTIPHTRRQRILQPLTVRERLADPVRRHNQSYSKMERNLLTTTVINPATGLPWTIYYVDPNNVAMGDGTVENPFMNLADAIAANSAAVDAIRIAAANDGTNTKLAVAGGIDLFDDQALFSAHKDFALFNTGGMDFVISGTAQPDGFIPTISDPTIGAGDAVLRIANASRINGLGFNASNAAGTDFGTGIGNMGAFTDTSITCSTFLNYRTGVELTDADGDLVFSENTFTGSPATSTHGLMVTTALGSSSDLLIEMNTATGNSVAGLYARASAGSTIDADNPLGFPLGAGTRSGVIDNTTNENGDGISLNADAGATFNAVVERNTSNGNTLASNGFVARADGVGALFNLASPRGNTFNMNGENGAFLHYLNGASFMSVTEDADGDGFLDGGEDLNGNGMLDQGIVSNEMSHNMIAGLCIFGEGDPAVDDSGTGGSGIFDIGGPTELLGNTFIGNLGAGIAVDLQDSATIQTDTLFNTITSVVAPGATTPALTFVLDFWEASQGAFTDAFGNDIVPFDVAGFGFAATDFDLVTNAVLDQVRDHYYGIPTVGTDGRSSIPDGQQLAIDFVLGDVGSAPSNGATEFYYAVIGGSTSPGTPLGIAFLSAGRNAGGTGPNGGTVIGDQIASVYSDNINGLGGLTPADIGSDEPADLAVAGDNLLLQDALTSGNLTFTRNALAGTVSHEVGHTLSLEHLNAAGAITPTGAPPIMGTGAIDLSNQARIGLREFAFTGQNAEAGGATQNHVDQLVGALGTRSALQSGASGHGITYVATNRAVVEPSTWINNTIENLGGTGLSLQMNDSARAEGVTIQGNTSRNNSGRGINLEANGPLAFIEASNTIGGAGMNTLGGLMFPQGNVITGNQNDGIRALVSDGGTIQGNVISNEISENAGNGIALLIENGGNLLFGDAASNQLITGNTISGNVGAGIFANSNVSVDVDNTEQAFELLIVDNVVDGNTGGGIVAELSGSNNIPPGPPAFGSDENNVLNLTINQSSDLFTIDGNGGVGIGVTVNGNGLANVDISDVVVSNTIAGNDPLFNGDGINLIRRDSSLLLATLENVTARGNASNGLEVDTQGTDKDNQNQPMSGTVNSVDWNNSLFENNGANGVSFRTRGDSQLFANGSANVLRNNTRSGALVTTSENSSFGDPTVVPDHRSIWSGITSEGNGRDGIELVSIEASQLLLEIRADRIPTTSGAHAALNTNGNTSISNNGRDGIHIESGDGSIPDILITAEMPVTAASATTIISGNGTAGDGGNGIRWDSFDSAGGIVQVYNTSIFGNIAGVSEDLNGDGILTFTEDTLGNFDQNQLGGTTQTGGNLDIDVAHGDGIQFNYFNVASSTLIVGDAGMGNFIQLNQDDGIALTGDQTRTVSDTDEFGNTFVSDSTVFGTGAIPSPTIVISNNQIGGERDGVDAGNFGDGVSIRGFGHTDEGVAPEDVDFMAPTATTDADGDPVSPGLAEGTFVGSGAADLDGNFTNGPTPDITLVDNTISRNDRIGVNIRLQGGAGFFDTRTPRPPASFPGFFNQITLDGNTIVSNGEEGVFLRADSDMNQNRIIFLPNLETPPGSGNFDNTNYGSANLAANSGFPADDFRGPFFNLGTVQNTVFTVTGNTIQNNGTNTINGEGLEIRVGTGSYVAADIRDNIFGGNLEEDLFTASFASAVDTSTGTVTRVNTFDSFDNTGDGTFDVFYLDDAALLDARFTGNSGNMINPQEEAFVLSTGSTVAQDISSGYDNDDPLKGTGTDVRLSGIFKIDDIFSLNAPVNTFIQFGATQSITGAFGTYTIQRAAPVWPEDPYQ